MPISNRPRWLSTVSAYAALGRLPDAIVAFTATCIGTRLAAPAELSAGTVVALAGSNALLSAASMTFNDWHDVAEDAINKPRRPIPAGRVPRASALRASAVLLAGAVALATRTAPVFGWVALLLGVVSALYTLRLKRIPLLGNVIVALVASYSLACWMLVTPLRSAYLVVAIGCVALRLGGELVKTAEDVAGDGTAGIPTVATRWGVERAKQAGWCCVSLGLVFGSFPILRDESTALYGVTLALAASLTVMAWMGMLGVVSRRSPSGSQLVALERAVTTLMVVGLALGLRGQG